MPELLVNDQVLKDFGACRTEREKFVEQYPDGFDIGGLYGNDEAAAAAWSALLASRWKRQIGWAISVGLLPAKIRADLRGADLRWANLSGADLSEANLSEANRNNRTIWPEGFTTPRAKAG